MNENCILVIDTGTSSMRGGLLNHDAQLIMLHQEHYSISAGYPSLAEQDCREFIQLLHRTLHAVKCYLQEHRLHVDAISVTSQRSSLISVDCHGKPLHRAIMWQDKRTLEICKEINHRMNTYPACGMRANTVLLAPKILWLKRNENELYLHTHKFLGIHEYILFQLTGEFCTDTSVASRSCLLDIRSGSWSEMLLDCFEIPVEKLCRLEQPGSVVGNTSASTNHRLGQTDSIPVISAGGDQQCASLGQGIFREGVLNVNGGTGGYATQIVDSAMLDPDEKIVLNFSAIPGKWILESSCNHAGTIYRWLQKNFYPGAHFSDMDHDAEKIDPGAEGIIFLADLANRLISGQDIATNNHFYPANSSPRKECMTRAVLEGIVSELYRCIVALERMGGTTDEIISSGGLSKGRLFNQILADISGKKVVTHSHHESTLIGAWIAGAVRLGWHSDYQAAARIIVQDPQPFFPLAKNRSIYLKQDEIRRQVSSNFSNQ